jgi:hypothetical protein
VSPLQAVLAYVVGPLIITIGTILAAKFAQRGSETAAKTTATAEKEVSVVDGYHQLVSDLRVDFDRLRDDHNALVEDHDELKSHVKGLEHQAQRDRNLIRHLWNYIRILREKIVQLNGVPPEPPPVLREDLDTGAPYTA